VVFEGNYLAATRIGNFYIKKIYKKGLTIDIKKYIIAKIDKRIGILSA